MIKRIFPLIISACFLAIGTPVYAKDFTNEIMYRVGLGAEDISSVSNANDGTEDPMTSTVNIRCYVDENIKEWDETIFFSIYNKTINSTTEFQLNAVNGYYDNINVRSGDCYLYATIENNDGTYSLYCPEQEFTVNNDSVDIVCAYGTSEYIESLKPNWNLLQIYEETNISLINKDNVNILNNSSESTEKINEIPETEETSTEHLIMPINEITSQKESRLLNIPGMILFFIMIVYIGYNIWKKKKRT